MRNITLSVDERVLAVVRRQAAERKSSVSAMVRDYLTNLAAARETGLATGKLAITMENNLPKQRSSK